MTNPILSFSSKRRMRSIRTPVLLTVYSLALALLIYFTVYSAFLKPTITISNMRNSVAGYSLLLILQFGLLVLIAPAMTAGSVSGERERQTLDLLLVTNTSPLQLILGKLLESFGFLSLLVLCSMPTLSMVLLTGGATFIQVVISIVFLLLISLAALSVGLFCSTLFTRTVTSTVVSYLTVFGIGILTLLPLFYDVKQLGAHYDSVNIAGQILPQYLDYIPISHVINPGLGLFLLIDTQTGMLGTSFWYMFSHTMTVTYPMLHPDQLLIYNMIFLAGLSLVLTVLSALNVRMKKAGKAKGIKKQ